MIISAIREFSLDDDEYATVCEFAKITVTEYKIHSIKLMPKIEYTSDVKIKPIPFDNNIFVNDSSNKPTCNNKVDTQSFITVEVSEKVDPFNSDDGYGNVNPGDRVILSIINNNMRHMFVNKMKLRER